MKNICIKSIIVIAISLMIVGNVPTYASINKGVSCMPPSNRNVLYRTIYVTDCVSNGASGYVTEMIDNKYHISYKVRRSKNVIRKNIKNSIDEIYKICVEEDQSI